MGVHIEVPDVSEEVYRVLRARAVRSRIPLSVYLRNLLGAIAAETPDMVPAQSRGRHGDRQTSPTAVND